MDAFIEIAHLHKTFETSREVSTPALIDVSLTIPHGDFAVISGPSGSGKTTLLNLLGALDSPSKGTISLGQTMISKLKEAELSPIRRDRIGFVFQTHNLIPVLSARQNICYVMRLQGRSQQEQESRVAELAGKLDIEQLLDKHPDQLSGGQQQRVAVARAVASRPQLLLADEPTASLDSTNAERLLDLLEQLNHDEGVTVLISSHDSLVINRARHSIVLRDGRVVADHYERNDIP
ncbi:MAG: ABC transporter ATP-binding protein [Desulfobulbaceae bacterium]|uniref:ABC transporter ATP-binding protein n=1 Tax=Candidatus Desulfatifera sulfidica TaxID=2841691 RepID=A0A8J6N838_9BACT|nr:ABC transporter ATP-binding protein [Candidatus Desulfatifera sulfidica]